MVKKTIRFNENDYEFLLNELAGIIKEYNITKMILGFPKNMNNTLGEKAKLSYDTNSDAIVLTFL